MTTEMNTKIKTAMVKAYTYLGETDAEFIAEKVDNELDTLNCLMIGADPNVVHTNVGDLTGYLVDIAVASADGVNVTALQLLVAEHDVHYIVNTYTLVKSEDWTPDDDLCIENESNRVVDLSEVDVSVFA
jgi:hypothetical protein